MTAIILAGGKSSRFGSNKAFIEIRGIPLIERELKLLKKVFNKIIIVTNQPHKSRSFYKMLYSLNKKGRDKYRIRNVKIIQDIIKDCGPLGGIYSGLEESDSFYNFVVSCDVPFLNLDLIRYMVRLKDGFDIVIPKLKKGFETLFAIYSKNCIAAIYKILSKARKPGLNSDALKVTNFFNKVKLRKLNEKEISRFGDPDILFMNINTPEDLALLKKMRGKVYD